jgi:hypothetical protein
VSKFQQIAAPERGRSTKKCTTDSGERGPEERPVDWTGLSVRRFVSRAHLIGIWVQALKWAGAAWKGAGWPMDSGARE